MQISPWHMVRHKIHWIDNVLIELKLSILRSEWIFLNDIATLIYIYLYIYIVISLWEYINFIAKDFIVVSNVSELYIFTTSFYYFYNVMWNSEIYMDLCCTQWFNFGDNGINDIVMQSFSYTHMVKNIVRISMLQKPLRVSIRYYDL